MIRIVRPEAPVFTSVELPGSKSESNRLLVLAHLAGKEPSLRNLSAAHDTGIMRSLLNEIARGNKELNTGDAGTVMRFLTAVLSITPGSWNISGSDRMHERPIGPLVHTLRELGADISFGSREGFPPLIIHGKKLSGGSVEMEAGISSQFITAVMLIAPYLEKGISINLKGEAVSAPYIYMTAGLLKNAGIRVDVSENHISVLPGTVSLPHEIQIESDWSAASYWYAICALQKDSGYLLKGLRAESAQADAIATALFLELGVVTTFTDEGAVIRNTGAAVSELNADLIACPDIAQALVCACIGLGVDFKFTGLRTLHIKETDRIAAMCRESEKFGVSLQPGKDVLVYKRQEVRKPVSPVHAYNDHRMAMSFSVLSCLTGEVMIDDEEAVNKSYPSFWHHLRAAAFNVTLLP